MPGAFINRLLPVCLLLTLTTGGGSGAAPRVAFVRPFAPTEGWVKPLEKPWREEVCLNGRWQFQPVAVPAAYVRDRGTPPNLPLPSPQGWSAVPIKVPSSWNVNTWGNGRRVGPGTERPYWPDSVYYPSYPEAWDTVEMGWLRRTFRLPPGWGSRRIVLHFEAVAGECRVLVNGRSAGGHFDKYLPFEMDITRLVRRSGSNELLVGVRAHSLFDRRSVRYPKMRAPYPCGSETERQVGIWQDVYLLGLPPVRVEDAFVKPLLGQDTLEVEVTLRNDTDREQRVRVGGEARRWINRAQTGVLNASEPRWTLGAKALGLPGMEAVLRPGTMEVVTLRARVAGRLRLWSPDSPALYGLLLSVRQDGKTLDRRYARFGWRQFRIRGRDLTLNGRRIQLFGDLLHPFGPFVMSRRHTWAWYRLIKDFGGNAVRPHAQIHPRHYMDLADEMGLVVLDETAIFGSSVALNFEEPAAWKRFADHYDRLVRRDRSHPSVLGWSFGNELFAIFSLNRVSPEDTDRWYRKLAALALRARRLDPTREWISCDGDEDLRGALPVWSQHFGHGTTLDRLPDIEKPLMVGESGGTYYARPSQLAAFNGPRAYESYAGRSEALAIDVYDNIVRMARPRLAYFSASETAWFGIEHLNLGYRDFHRLPDRRDGVYLTRSFTEGTPGMQPERLPPYVTTLNPGWDPGIPLYRPLTMFHAQKAALSLGGPKPGPWDRRSVPARQPGLLTRPSIERVAFIGKRSGAADRTLRRLGVPLEESGYAMQPGGMVILDSDTLEEDDIAPARAALERVRSGGTALVLLGNGAFLPEQLTALLPAPVRLTARPATMLASNPNHSWTAPFTAADLYFAEEGANRHIMRCGLEGPLVEQGTVLLKAGRADWWLFNDAPESAKCAAVLLYERLKKPSGAALVVTGHGRGMLALCTLDYRGASRTADLLWCRLLANMGVVLRPAREGRTAAFNDEGVLVHALAIGPFDAPDVKTALEGSPCGQAATLPRRGISVGGRTWTVIQAVNEDRFFLSQPGPAGEGNAFVVCFSVWIKSPRALDDLLAGGPDMPRVALSAYVSERCRLLLNGRELPPAHTEPADYRTLYTFDTLPLKKGWNHLLLQVASRRLEGEHPGTLAIRLRADPADFLRQLETAVESEE